MLWLRCIELINIATSWIFDDGATPSTLGLPTGALSLANTVPEIRSVLALDERRKRYTLNSLIKGKNAVSAKRRIPCVTMYLTAVHCPSKGILAWN